MVWNLMGEKAILKCTEFKGIEHKNVGRKNWSILWAQHHPQPLRRWPQESQGHSQEQQQSQRNSLRRAGTLLRRSRRAVQLHLNKYLCFKSQLVEGQMLFKCSDSNNTAMTRGSPEPPHPRPFQGPSHTHAMSGHSVGEGSAHRNNSCIRTSLNLSENLTLKCPASPVGKPDWWRVELVSFVSVFVWSCV